MNKILIQAIILSFLFLANSFSEIIKKVEISGNKRISDQTVLILGNISMKCNIGIQRLTENSLHYNEIEKNI